MLWKGSSDIVGHELDASVYNFYIIYVSLHPWLQTTSGACYWWDGER